MPKAAQDSKAIFKALKELDPHAYIGLSTGLSGNEVWYVGLRVEIKEEMREFIKGFAE